jgi:hypothetical protein
MRMPPVGYRAEDVAFGVFDLGEDANSWDPERHFLSRL